jgi:hypothetical protein
MTRKSKRKAKAKAAHKTPATIIQAAYTIVTDMEDDVEVAKDLANAVAYIAQTVNESDVGCTLQRLAWTIKTHVESIENRRGDLFDLLHPHSREVVP